VALAATTLALGCQQAAADPTRPPGPSGANGTPMEATHWITVGDPAIISGSDKPTGRYSPKQQPPAPRPTVPRHVLAAAKLAAAKDTRPRAEDTAPQPKAPPVDQGSFEGLNQGAFSQRPPDTHGAVGLNHFVEVTNGTGLGFYNKASGTLISSTTLNNFFQYGQLIFNPRVVYDRVWNRWVIFADSLPRDANFQFVFLAVSQTSDPLGNYWKFAFDVPEIPGDFFDYPQLGMSQDALIVTGNVFTEGTYVRSRAFGIPKAAAYNGKGWSMPYFNLGTPGTVAPPIIVGNNANAYLVAASTADPDNLKLFRATGLGLSNVSIVFQSNIPVIPFAVPPDARQPGTTDLLDTLDARFQNNSTQIGNQLLNVHTVNVLGFPTPKWYQIDTSTNTVPTGRTGNIFESGTSDDFNPAIVGSTFGGTSANPIGRMFLTWTSTNAFTPHQARVKGSGRLGTDAVTIVGGTTFTEATTFYDPSANTVESWGAYSAVTIDPVVGPGCPVGQRAFVVNERQISSTLWGSRIGRLSFC
jgi:hypothetical protein